MALVMRVLAGLLLWAAGFTILYGLHGLGCAVGWADVRLGPVSLLSMVLVGTWLAFLALALLTALLLWRGDGFGQSGFLRRVGLISALAGLGGLIFTGAPVLLPAHCL
jgi:hypothetical protein